MTFLILRSKANKAKTMHRGIRCEISFTNSLVSMRLLDPLLGEKFNYLERGKQKRKLFSIWISLHKSRKELGGRVDRALFKAWQMGKGRGAGSGSRDMPRGKVQGQGEWVQAGSNLALVTIYLQPGLERILRQTQWLEVVSRFILTPCNCESKYTICRIQCMSHSYKINKERQHPLQG